MPSVFLTCYYREPDNHWQWPHWGYGHFLFGLPASKLLMVLSLGMTVEVLGTHCIKRHGKNTVKRKEKESSRRYWDTVLEAFLCPFVWMEVTGDNKQAVSAPLFLSFGTLASTPRLKEIKGIYLNLVPRRQRGEVTRPRSLSKSRASPKWEPRSSHALLGAFHFPMLPLWAWFLLTRLKWWVRLKKVPSIFP